jgi:lycopene beta-cyclase
MKHHSTRAAFDYALVGGGLQNALIAMALLTRRPGTRIAMIERDVRLGGNHIWCFHAGDVTPQDREFVDPLVVHRWNGYSVRFPGRTRELALPYAAVTCAVLHDVVSARLARASGCELITGTGAIELGAGAVVLEDGRRLEARAVIDSRGPDPDANAGSAGYQKFLGQELELASPHRLARPVIMDATVAQDGGFRFFYTLPLSPHRLLVEETFFADTPELDRDGLRRNIAGYARQRGYDVSRVVREETGILPMPWRGRYEPDAKGVLVAGYRGGWFHPATGYSFPVAVRVADQVSRTAPGDMLGKGLRVLAADTARQRTFAYRLNELLFGWFAPDQRYHVFERFYGLPEATIQRFYGLAMNRGDRARILLGRPPRGLSLRHLMSRRLASRRRAS